MKVELIQCVFVGLLWGATNALLERGVKSSDDDKSVVKEVGSVPSSSTILSKLVKFLVNALQSLTKQLLNWRVTVPFLLNQLGSLLFYLILGSSDLSLAVPMTNGATLLFTFLTTVLLENYYGESVEEEAQTKYDYRWMTAGILLTSAGLWLIGS